MATSVTAAPGTDEVMTAVTALVTSPIIDPPACLTLSVTMLIARDHIGSSDGIGVDEIKSYKYYLLLNNPSVSQIKISVDANTKSTRFILETCEKSSNQPKGL